MKRVNFFLVGLYQLFFVYLISLGAEAQTFKYTYDNLGRVTTVDDTVNGNRYYQYDSVGNRTLVTADIPVTTPVISPNGGNFTSEQTVSIQSETLGAVIYYTTDNTLPTVSSNRFSTPFKINATKTVRAIATKLGMKNSKEVTAIFSILLPVALPIFSPDGGAITSVDKINITSTSGASIYYSIDGSTPAVGSATSTLFGAPFSLNTNATVKAIAVKNGMGNSDIKSAAFTISNTLVKPGISPNGSTFSTTQSVTLSTATSGASIYYTTDNSTPTTGSTLYSSPFMLTGSATVRAIVVKQGLTTSPEASATFTYAPQLATPSISPNGGAWPSPQPVTITATPADAKIYYTTDNSPATTGSMPYTGMITLTASTTVKAIAVKAGMTASNEAAASFTVVPQPDAPINLQMSQGDDCYWNASWSPVSGVDNYFFMDSQGNTKTITTTSTTVICPKGNAASQQPKSVQACKSGVCSAKALFGVPPAAVATPNISPNGATFNSTQAVTLSSATAGASIYYTINNTAPTTASTPYSAPFTLTDNATVRVIAVKQGMGNSAEASANFTRTINIAAPGISPNGGAWPSPQPVTISTATSGALIYYTTNNTAPSTSSTLYSGQITLTGNTTIRAIAVKPDVGSSAETSASFTIVPQPNAPSNLQFNLANDCVWNASWSAVADADSYFFMDTLGNTKTIAATSTTIICPSGTSQNQKPKSVQACKSGVCSAKSLFADLPAAAPSISPNGGSFSSTQTISLSSTTVGATIYYTTDGTAPNTNSPVYSNSFVLNSSATVRALAVKLGMTNSSESSANFTITAPIAAPAITPNSGTFNNSQSVSISTLTPGATIYYTTNNTTPTISSSVYTNPFMLGSSSVVRAIAVKQGMANSPESSASITILSPVSSPGISPGGGSFSSAQTVSLSSATQGAAIYYTTNNSTPTTNSSYYSGSFVVNSSSVVRAIAVKQGMADSSESSATFSIVQSVFSPGISPAGGTFSNTQTVTLTSATPGASIYYTTNNTAPTTGSNYYGGSFTVSSTSVIRAIAVKQGMTDSTESSANFTIMPLVSAPGVSPNGGTFASAQSVTLSSATPGAAIYYTTNNTAPTTSSTVYSGPFTVTSDAVVRAIAVKANMTNSGESSASFTIMQTVASPSISPSSGSYVGSVPVTLSSISGASIYYTTNNSVPTTSSTLYANSPFTLTSNATVRAIAVKQGMNNSTESSAIYTIQVPPAVPANAHASFINSCVWKAEWNLVPDADSYYFMDSQGGTKTVAGSPVNVICPTGSPNSLKPQSVQACKAGLCSAKAYF